MDGVPTPILRANALSRAVIVPPTVDGKPHEVTFVFRPWSARLGGAISLLTMTLVCSVLVMALSGFVAMALKPIPFVRQIVP